MRFFGDQHATAVAAALVADAAPTVILTDWFCLAIGQLDRLQGPLLAEERSATAGMSRRRLAEFAAGRTAARLALRAAGLPPSAIPVGDDRAPRWPEGFAGSISHGTMLAAAAVGGREAIGSIGIDVEDVADFPAEAIGAVLSAVELTQFASIVGGSAAKCAKLAFSCKESVFKADWPRRQIHLDYTDIAIELQTADSAIARLQGSAAASYRLFYTISGMATFTLALPMAAAESPHNDNKMRYLGRSNRC